MPRRKNGRRRRGQRQLLSQKSSSVASERANSTAAVLASHRTSKKRKATTSRPANKEEQSQQPPADGSFAVPTTDVNSPPELKVMVSDSELWMIRERNKQNGVVEGGSTKVSNAGSYVVVTEVFNDGSLVTFKECYSPFGFFEHCYNSNGGADPAKEWSAPFRPGFMV